MRPTRALAVAAATALIVGALPTAGLAHDDPQTRDDWKAVAFESSDVRLHALARTLQRRDDAGIAIERASENIQLIARADVGPASDLMLQRREGQQVLKGVTITGTRDFAFVGGIGPFSDGSTPYGFSTVDVTDPENPEVLAFVECGAFHNDVVVWEHLLILGSDGSGTNCEQKPEFGLPFTSGNGVQVFDVSDPAAPRLLRVFHTSGDGVPISGPHNISVNPEAGLLYLSTAGFREEPVWGYVDLNDFGEDTEMVIISQREITPESGDGCHDQGIAHGVTDAQGNVRDLIFCAAITGTHIWDITADPRSPVHVATIVNPAINIHHGARLASDGTTLILNDELAGAAAAAGCQGGAPAGAQWMYDISTPETPVFVGTTSTSELNPAKLPCTSHFYNNIPTSDGSTKIVTGWYRSGMIVHDLSEVPLPPTEEAFLLPEGATFWAAYAWHGYLFGASYGEGDGSGLFIAKLDGMEDLDPISYDEGTSWSRWTPAGTVQTSQTITTSIRAEIGKADGWAWALLA